MELKIGDKILDDDGIARFIYTIVKINEITLGKVAIGETTFEGKTYQMVYWAKYEDPKNIRPLTSVLNDFTRRELLTKGI